MQMPDVWLPRLVIGAQCVAAVVLGVCVAMGHDSVITDALLVVCGSLAGTGVLGAIAKKPPPAPFDDQK